MNQSFKEIYVDLITWSILFKLIIANSKSICVLDKSNRQDSLKFLILKFFGKSVFLVDFFAGDLIDKDDKEGVHIKSLKMTNDLVMQLSANVIKFNPALKRINKLYGNNTLQLHITKHLQLTLFDWILKINTFKVLSNSKNDVVIIIKAPFCFSDEIKKLYPKTNIIFYNKKFNSLKETIKLLFKELSLRIIQRFYIRSKYNKTPYPNKFSKGVLTVQEESIRKDQSLRGHLHWLDFNIKQKYPFHTLSFRNASSTIVDDIKQLNDKNIYVHSKSIVNHAIRQNTNNPHIKEFNKEIKILIRALLGTQNNQVIFTIKTIFLMYKAVDLASICLQLNTKVYVIKEPYFVYSDAIQMVAEKIQIKVLGYQYSNIGYYSPLMMPSSDIFLSFSNAYKKLFSIDKLGPVKIKSMGYLLEGVEPRLMQRVKSLKNELQLKGVNFTIAYFGESIQFNKWGCFNEKGYKTHVILLAKKVLQDPTLAVVFKSQFIAFSIEKFFKGNEIISKAFKTGRFINILSGAYRNEVYPLQVALVSDICINEKVGGTAALEAASAGRRCILLNKQNYKTIHDPVYESANIVFKNISQALYQIDIHRKNIEKGLPSNLGDWGQIKEYFLSKEENRGIHKIKSEVMKPLKN
mgnify:CR=1 FL=1